MICTYQRQHQLWAAEGAAGQTAEAQCHAAGRTVFASSEADAPAVAAAAPYDAVCPLFLSCPLSGQDAFVVLNSFVAFLEAVA